MTEQAEQHLTGEQRSQIVHGLARNWEIVHGTSPGCLTGFMSLPDRELIAEAESYQARAAAAVGDDR